MAFHGYFEPYFTTATIKDWKWLLKPDKYKEIIIESFAYLVSDQNVFQLRRGVSIGRSNVFWT